MSEENKMREELKAQDVELNPEELDTVAGGDSFGIYDNSGTIVPCCIHCGKSIAAYDLRNALEAHEIGALVTV